MSNSTAAGNNPSAPEMNALNAYLDAGDLLRTERECRGMLQRYPGSAMLNNLLGIVFYTNGRSTEAMNCYQLAIKSDPGYADAHNNMGLLLNSLGRNKEAIESFENVVKLNPDDTDALNNLGVLLQEQHRAEEALRYLSRAIKLSPNSAPVHFNYGNSLRARGLLKEAVAMFGRAIQLQPDFAESYNNCAGAFEDLQLLDEASNCYSRAIQLQPTYALAYSNRGALQKKRSNHEAALEDFRHTLEYGNWTSDRIDQNLKFRLLVNIGDILMYLRRFAEALDAYEKAHAAEPENSDILAFKGNAIAAMGRLAEGLRLRQASFGFIAFDNKAGVSIKHGAQQ